MTSLTAHRDDGGGLLHELVVALGARLVEGWSREVHRSVERWGELGDALVHDRGEEALVVGVGVGGRDVAVMQRITCGAVFYDEDLVGKSQAHGGSAAGFESDHLIHEALEHGGDGFVCRHAARDVEHPGDACGYVGYGVAGEWEVGRGLGSVRRSHRYIPVTGGSLSIERSMSMILVSPT